MSDEFKFNVVRCQRCGKPCTLDETCDHCNKVMDDLVEKMQAKLADEQPVKPEITVRYAQDLDREVLDELVADNANIQVERMGDGCWFIGIETANEYLMCHVGSQPKPGTDYGLVIEHYKKKD